MKHQSKAEEALNKQIKILNHQIESLSAEFDKLGSRIEAVQGVRDQLMDEVIRSKQAREASAEKQSTKLRNDIVRLVGDE